MESITQRQDKSASIIDLRLPQNSQSREEESKDNQILTIKVSIAREERNTELKMIPNPENEHVGPPDRYRNP